MPRLENQVPGRSRNALVRRRARKERVERYLRDVTVPMQAVRVRKELGNLERLFDEAVESKDLAQLAEISLIQARLRTVIFRLAGVPREPIARPSADPRGPLLEATILGEQGL